MSICFKFCKDVVLYNSESFFLLSIVLKPHPFFFLIAIQCISFNYCLIFHQMTIFQLAISVVVVAVQCCISSIGTHFYVYMYRIPHPESLGEQRQPPAVALWLLLQLGHSFLSHVQQQQLCQPASYSPRIS